MRVVCIDDGAAEMGEGVPKLVRGNIYNVVEEVACNGMERVNGQLPYSGIYYVLAETGNNPLYHESLFVVINENDIDETELIKQRETCEV